MIPGAEIKDPVACGISSYPWSKFQSTQCPASRVHFAGSGKVNTRPPGKGNSNCHGARPVHLIITMIQWIRTSSLSIKKSLWQVVVRLTVHRYWSYHSTLIHITKSRSPIALIAPQPVPGQDPGQVRQRSWRLGVRVCGTDRGPGRGWGAWAGCTGRSLCPDGCTPGVGFRVVCACVREKEKAFGLRDQGFWCGV